MLKGVMEMGTCFLELKASALTEIDKKRVILKVVGTFRGGYNILKVPFQGGIKRGGVRGERFSPV